VDAPSAEARPPATTDIVPPPPDEGPITLFLSDSVLPASGADLVAVLRNTGTEGAVFGVSAMLDRWDGTRAHHAGRHPVGRPLLGRALTRRNGDEARGRG
jgi:hypothetical protein